MGQTTYVHEAINDQVDQINGLVNKSREVAEQLQTVMQKMSECYDSSTSAAMSGVFSKLIQDMGAVHDLMVDATRFAADCNTDARQKDLAGRNEWESWQ